MKKKSTSKSAFFNLRVLIASVLCLFGIAVALLAQGRGAKQTQQASRSSNAQDAPSTQKPDVVQMIGPVRQNQDLRNLPYIRTEGESDEEPLTRYPHPNTGAPPPGAPSSPWLQRLVKGLFRPTPTILFGLRYQQVKPAVTSRTIRRQHKRSAVRRDRHVTIVIDAVEFSGEFCARPPITVTSRPHDVSSLPRP